MEEEFIQKQLTASTTDTVVTAIYLFVYNILVELKDRVDKETCHELVFGRIIITHLKSIIKESLLNVLQNYVVFLVISQ